MKNIVKRADAISIALIAFAALRILATLTVFSATADEGVHVSAGLQLIQEKRYGFQLENPPLPRLVMAWPLHLTGGKYDPTIDPMLQAALTFFWNGHYKSSLFAARAGNTLFFIIAALATWRLARRELGPAGGAMATLLFTTQPVVLGLTGIANLDIACVAGLALTLLAFSRWIEQPSALRAAITGAVYGLSIGLKFSNALFGAAACLALFLVHSRTVSWKRALLALPVAVIMTFAGLWASYGFTIGSLDEYGMIKPAPMTSLARLMAPLETSTVIPMPHFFVGIANLANLEKHGHLSYAFGQRTSHGWWWYFPVAMFFKTALATLIFAVAGFFVARGKTFFGAIAAMIAILITTAPAAFDLGVRYVLAAYVPLTIAAAAAAMAMLNGAKRLRIAAIVLLVWQCGASLLAHPDYFPYFNELAGREPGRLLIDSNLDWGQDMLRLREVLREEKIPKVGTKLAGMNDLERLGFPPNYDVNPWIPTQGWIAVSEHMYQMLKPDGGFAWLRGREYRRVGKSIRLYYVP